ncbi:HD domain-containing phosphohydrolase [Desulfuribacillus alkaliarsenatis]|uniref:HD domain-containing phosphohydrolase n=1 Tax=Desulfuribacillus alkaliarsenatis TaxID=766136 RepID=UPI00345B8B58
MDFPSRLLACLDIYQALRESRPYRPAMDHKQAMEILKSIGENNKVDSMIVNDIDNIFAATAKTHIS